MAREVNLEQVPWSVLLGVAQPLGVLVPTEASVYNPLHMGQGFWSVRDMLRLRATCKTLCGDMNTQQFLTALLKSAFKIDVGRPFHEYRWMNLTGREDPAPMPVSVLEGSFRSLSLRWRQNRQTAPCPGRDPDHEKKEWLCLLLEEAFKQQFLRALVRVAERLGCVVAGSYGLHDFLHHGHTKEPMPARCDRCREHLMQRQPVAAVEGCPNCWVPGDVDVFGPRRATVKLMELIRDCDSISAKARTMGGVSFPYAILHERDGGQVTKGGSMWDNYMQDFVDRYGGDDLVCCQAGVSYDPRNIDAYLRNGPPAAPGAMHLPPSVQQALATEEDEFGNSCFRHPLANPEYLRPLQDHGWFSAPLLGTMRPAYEVRRAYTFEMDSTYFPLRLQRDSVQRYDELGAAGPLARRRFCINAITIDCELEMSIEKLLDGFDLEPCRVAVTLPPHETMYQHTLGKGAEEAIEKRILRRTEQSFAPCQIFASVNELRPPLFLFKGGPIDKAARRIAKYARRGFVIEKL